MLSLLRAFLGLPDSLSTIPIQLDEQRFWPDSNNMFQFGGNY